jgi:hypothetical protein
MLAMLLFLAMFFMFEALNNTGVQKRMLKHGGCAVMSMSEPAKQRCPLCKSVTDSIKADILPIEKLGEVLISMAIRPCKLKSFTDWGCKGEDKDCANYSMGKAALEDGD